MPDDIEHNFFYSLRLVTILLIKHASPVYKVLLPLAQQHEEGTWNDLGTEQKAQQIDQLMTHAGATGSITQHFDEFPHEWSCNQFRVFVEALNVYCRTLKNQPGTKS